MTEAHETPPPEEAPKPASAQGVGVKLALELGPLVVFFGTYKFFGIYVATGVFMVTSIVSLVLTWRREHRIPPMPLVTAVLVLVLGGLTIWLQNDTFLKLKVTAINALFGSALLVATLFRRKLLKHLLGEAIHLADAGWATLTWIWIGYFISLAALNEVVWRNTTTDTWVNFKTFALPALSLVFLVVQLPVMSKHQLPDPKPAPGVD
jgi:intracellular septation protein